ncbi:hypothetical protein DXX93_15485 [Thalassotalea euphylliae]|uniref:Outer membrane protein beta-barrel domain-containing protein n=1 Tax=Thalassotalea euphylliae TaxID=1655234 RepID=A0A3E0TWF9_9GAMM|nr:hypothetical protein DXX93_15485 [Thalassotalea euphylliae]
MWLVTSTAALLTLPSQANDIDFSLGTGYPYFIIPEVSFPINNARQRLYANYKIGLDDGFSVGFEHSLTTDNTHAIGILAGAIGARDDERPCPNTADNDSSSASLGEAIACGLLEVFDDETTNGVGLSYSYNHNGLNHSGFRIRFELGYGKGKDSDESRADAGIILSYQF